MQAMIKGIDVILYNKVEKGKDGFDRPVYEEIPETIHNVLVGEPSSDGSQEVLNMDGKVISYTLGIPKNDNHIWEDRIVEFFGKKFRTVGSTVEGIDKNIPLSWNKKIKVVRYE